ncbi:MAG: alpha-amylase, partial [Planctomycetes bacterium]|nr:alpha-amylase [Planctomycetota bacterium]
TARPSADWVRDAVIYEVYLRSFSPEGDFRGLQRRLDDLRDLGVTVLWLMPIHPVGKARRKGSLGSPYAVADYYAVNPEFGTLDEFESLLDATHGRGMKLIIDLVANHTAWDNPLIHEHPDWFSRDRRGKIRSPLDDWTDVAQLDYRVPELHRYMVDVMFCWVRDIGVDGFRCDVAGMVPTDFWQHARQELDVVKAVMMLAEDDRPEQHLQAFDLTYDWRTYQALGRLRAGKLKPASLATILTYEQLDFPAGSRRLRFSGNHDLCAWHQPGMMRYGPAAARAAAVLTFALPGVPLIYNGQEVANRRKLHLFERTPIDWDAADFGMRSLLKELARLRRTRDSLRLGDVQSLDQLTETGIIGLCRTQRDEATYALINCTLEPCRVELSQLPHSPSATLLSNAPAGRPEQAGRIDLPPLGFWIGTAR